MPLSKERELPRSVDVPQIDLRQRLVWLTVFRTVATSLLLGAFSIPLLGRPGWELSRSDSLSFAVIALVYVSTLIYGLMLRRRAVGRTAALMQVAGDVIIATALILVTGGVESPFTFTYSLAVVEAAIVVNRRGAVITAFLCALAYATLLGLGQLQLLTVTQGAAPLTMGRAVYLMVSNSLALALIAALAGYLSSELSAQSGRLSEREADLHRLSSLHEQILACMPSGLITCDGDGQIIFVNPSASSILALSPEAALSQNLETVIPGMLHSNVNPRRREVTVLTPAGTRVLGLTLTDLDGTGGMRLIVFQDLTELRRIEEGLLRADRLAALGTLSAQLAHEIRNPLASMRGAAQLLGQESGADPTSVKLTQILMRESDRLSRLVEDFLRFARPPSPERADVDLYALVAETVGMVQNEPLAKGVTVTLALAAQHARVDADQLRQVLLNLLRNALQVSAGSGEVRVSLVSSGKEVHLGVWDSKGAIAASVLPRLFEPFFSTKEGGTGLGLATSHSIIRAHGGDIRVQSSPATGTEFLVVLPLA